MGLPVGSNQESGRDPTRFSAADREQGVSTLENVRLWDSSPLLEANRQLQQLRVYYRFSNAAVDRYPLNENSDSSQQEILSARELDQSALPRQSKTWQNRHFIFTHGGAPAGRWPASEHSWRAGGFERQWPGQWIRRIPAVG